MRQARSDSAEDGGGAPRRGPVMTRPPNVSQDGSAPGNPFDTPGDQRPCTRTGRAVSCPDLGGPEASVGPPSILIGGVELPDVEMRGAVIDVTSSTLQRARQETYTKRSAGLRHRLWMKAYLGLLKLSRRRRVQLIWGVLQIALVVFDIVTDWNVMVSLFANGSAAWGALSLVFIVGSYLLVYGSVLLYLRGEAQRGVDTIFVVWAVLGFPCGVLALDVLLLLEPFNLVGLFTNDDLQQFMPSYRSTRIIIEAIFEAFPQSILQLCIALQGDSGVPVFLLVQSLTFSAIHLVVITIFMLMAAQNANVSVWQHIKTQSQMGRGLPLAGLKRQKIKQWKYAGPVLTDAQVLELSSAFRQNRSVENVRITAAFSREEGIGRLWSTLGEGALTKLRSLEIPENAISDGDMLQFADSLCKGACIQLKVLVLSHNCIGDQGIEALARAMCYEQPGGHSALQHLIELKLERNLIGDRGAAALAMALRARAVRSLIELHLDHNLIGDKGLVALGKELHEGALPELDMLFLNNNQASEVGKRAVRQAMAALQLAEGDSFCV